MNPRSLEKLVFRARIARWSLAAIFAVFALAFVLTTTLLDGSMASPVASVTVGLFTLLPYVALFVFAIAYFLWLHRAARNLTEGAEGMRFSPAWHVASYFVPVANLVVPFLAMRELWNRSHGEPPELADAGVGSVASWWACWVAATLLLTGLLLRIFFTVFTGAFVVVPPLLDLIAMGLVLLLLVGASWFLFRIIGEVTRAQTGFVNVSATFA